MNNDYEFAVEEFDLPAEFENDEELSRFRRLPARSFSRARPIAPRVRCSVHNRGSACRRASLSIRVASSDAAPICTRRNHLPASEYVRWVQTMLNQALNLQLPIDGVMSVQTRSAVRSFQERQGLPVDGTVGPETDGR